MELFSKQTPRLFQWKSQVLAAKHSHIAANFASDFKASFSLDHDRTNYREPCKWHIQVTHLFDGFTLFRVVKELLQEWHQPIILGIQIVEQTNINVFDFGLVVGRLGDCLMDLFERVIVLIALQLEALLTQTQWVKVITIWWVSHIPPKRVSVCHHTD